MAKQLEPYKCAFSISNEILSKSALLSYRLGELCHANLPSPSSSEIALEVKAGLSREGVGIRPTQMKGLSQGEEVPSHPLASSLFKLYESLPRFNPFDPKFLQRFEETVWKDGVPHRLSRRVPFYPYPIPMHARIEDLLKGLMSFGTKGQSKVHPLVLAPLFYFEILAIMPYSEFDLLLASTYVKAILGRYHKVFQLVPINRLLLEKKDKIDEAIAASIEKGDTAPFVLAMLDILDSGVKALFHRSTSLELGASPLVQKLLAAMESGRFYSAAELCELLHLKSRLGLSKNYLRPALEAQLLVMSNPLAPTDRTQRYRKKEL